MAVPSVGACLYNEPPLPPHPSHVEHHTEKLIAIGQTQEIAVGAAFCALRCRALRVVLGNLTVSQGGCPWPRRIRLVTGTLWIPQRSCGCRQCRISSWPGYSTHRLTVRQLLLFLPWCPPRVAPVFRGDCVLVRVMTLLRWGATVGHARVAALVVGA